MSNLLASLIKPEFLFSVLRITSPILFAALAAVIAEKAGMTNIGPVSYTHLHRSGGV